MMTSTSLPRAKAYDDFSIQFVRQTIPAFTTRTSHWLDYEEIARREIASIDVDIWILGCHLGGGDIITYIDAFFDPNLFARAELGLVYGDALFETNVEAFIKHTLALPDDAAISYTEQGMQGEDYISMESSKNVDDILSGLSNHALLVLTANPLIKGLSAKGSQLKGEAPDP